MRPATTSQRGLPLNVLVTGAGTQTGQCVLRCLRDDKSVRLIATDISHRATGLFWAALPYVSPHWQDQDRYMATIREICTEHNVQVLFPGTDPEARILTFNNHWRPTHHVQLACSSPEVWNITGDKLATVSMAHKLGVAAPHSMPYTPESVAAIANKWGWPVVIKPRCSYGSRGIYYSYSELNLPEVTQPADYICQRYLDPTDNEYTVGAYFGAQGYSHAPDIMLAMRRTLYKGTTNSAEFIDATDFEPSVAAFGKDLDLRGYCNFQFISESSIPHLIEINARFSSSVSVGLAVECNFPLTYINDYVYGQSPQKMMSKPGLVVLRYYDDFVISRQDLERVVERG